MGHFAKIDENDVVIDVMIAEQDVIDSGLFGDTKFWIQTSINTQEGKHILGGTPLRKNYAQIGGTYDRKRDAFIPIKEFNSWILNEDSCIWIAPFAYPNDGKDYIWDEDTISWKEIVYN